MTAFSSAELIEALRRRTRRSLRPERPPGEFPPGWRDWFASLGERMGAVTGASSEAIVAILVQRELVPAPRRSGGLNRWQAFTTLWRQQWHPPGPEGRRERIIAYAITLVVQLLFSLFLLWLAYARFGGEPVPLGEDVVQVEFIGQGTPRDQGGGAASAPVEGPASAAPSQAAAPAAPPPPAPPAPSPAVAATTQAAGPVTGPATSKPRPAPPNVPPAQPLQVTQTPQPDSGFVLPPPVPRVATVPQQQVVVPELRESPLAIEVVEVPAPAPSPVQQIRPRLPDAQVAVPRLRTQVETLPSPAPPLPDASARQVAVSQAQVLVPSLRAPVASLPSPAQASTSTARADDAGRATVGTAPSAGNAPGTTAAPAAGTPATGSGAQANPAGAGAGPKPAARPGAWSTAQAGDDWGLSDRNRPGGQAGKPGLFDENGRPRLPPGNRPQAGGGLPPGVVEENIADLDRAGTWLKRPPIGYTPTRFDKFWAPSETLLQNWVRRNIREVAIPIPGSSKKIRCVVSLLQLGGACGIDDPNMQDQEATARPPPDIPFKPELQEDQDALRKPGESP